MYISSEKSMWTGRFDDENNKSSFRYHQAVTVETVDEIALSDVKRTAILSFECDEGVRRNNGRIGAAKGSYEIKKALSNLPWLNQNIVDAGIVFCEDEKLEEGQQLLGDKVRALLQTGNKVVILGGGHETLYGHYLGVRQAYEPKKKIGIINIDAHFDLRKYDLETSSGTMFNQILSQDPYSSYFVLGVQKYGNTLELFERAEKLNVKYILEQELTEMSKESIQNKINDFIKDQDVVLLTLCMDVLAAESAPGVSAPSVFGLQPILVRQIIQFVLNHNNVFSFDICEVNPSLDQDNRTAKLAAAFVNEVIVKMVN